MTVLDSQQDAIVPQPDVIGFWSAKKTSQGRTPRHTLPSVSTLLRQWFAVPEICFCGPEPASDDVKIGRPFNYPPLFVALYNKKLGVPVVDIV